MGCGWVFGAGVLRVSVQAHFCEIDGRVQGMQFGVLLQVLFWDAVWGAVGGASDGAGARLTAGCCLGRSLGVLLEVLVCNHMQSLLSGVYAGVIFRGCTFQGATRTPIATNPWSMPLAGRIEHNTCRGLNQGKALTGSRFFNHRP